MPKVHKQTARKDIFKIGIKVPDSKTKSGFRKDRSKPNPNGDTLLVSKGETYYSWTFRYGGQQISKEYPKRQQLTQSDYLIQLYDIQDRIDGFYFLFENIEEAKSELESIVSDLESLRDDTQEKFDNIPEQLQYAPVGEMLQERIDQLDEAISSLESIDFDIDEDLEEEEKDDEMQNVIDEIQSISLEG